MNLLNLLLFITFSSVNAALIGDKADRGLLSDIISLANKIQNAVPTMPTTPPPTTSPTYSAAPSPSPSRLPTSSPTMSMEPSSEPTIAPTASRSPTNVPTHSAQPSTKPSVSPTELPSKSPSDLPTFSPTESAKPSVAPSAAPTIAPSASPSISAAPTVSASPTLIYRLNLQANMSIPLPGIGSNLNANQTQVFERNAQYFIQQNVYVEGGSLLVTGVRVLGQRVDNLEDGKYLVVDFTVDSEYESLVRPDEFSFERKLQKIFESKLAVFKNNLLATGDPFFAPLDPAKIPMQQEDDTVYGYVAIIICSAVVLCCASFATYYVIRRSLIDNEKGDKVGSEMQEYPDDSVGSNLTEEDVGDGVKHSKSIEIIKVSHSPEKDTEEQEASYATTPSKNEYGTLHVETIDGTVTGTPSREGAYTEMKPKYLPQADSSKKIHAMSPNTMEAGTRLGTLAESILRSESFGSNRDPPTDANRYLYAPKPAMGDPAAKYRPGTFGPPRHDQRNDLPVRGSKSSRRDPSVVGASNVSSADLNTLFKSDLEQRGSSHSRSDLGQRTTLQSSADQRSRSDPSSNIEPKASFDRRRDWQREPSQDVQMTVGRNGKIGSSSKSFTPSSPSSSAVSSSINAFLNMVGGTLGAAPLAPSLEKKAERKPQSYRDVLQREGLYDVFAPAGALGIVVDTTKDGPAVHSLKQTSPMLGLINPGDLIVGLDEQDTRSMTAATLTRLMASKSNQKERKITLLAADY